jgi:hypothetical protein
MRRVTSMRSASGIGPAASSSVPGSSQRSKRPARQEGDVVAAEYRRLGSCSSGGRPVGVGSGPPAARTRCGGRRQRRMATRAPRAGHAPTHRAGL